MRIGVVGRAPLEGCAPLLKQPRVQSRAVASIWGACAAVLPASTASALGRPARPVAAGPGTRGAVHAKIDPCPFTTRISQSWARLDCGASKVARSQQQAQRKQERARIPYYLTPAARLELGLSSLPACRESPALVLPLVPRLFVLTDPSPDLRIRPASVPHHHFSASPCPPYRPPTQRRHHDGERRGADPLRGGPSPHFEAADGSFRPRASCLAHRAACSAHPGPRKWLTRCFRQQYQTLLDKSTPYLLYRWIGTAVFLMVFFLRILLAQGWYIGAHSLPSAAAAPCPSLSVHPWLGADLAAQSRTHWASTC